MESFYEPATVVGVTLLGNIFLNYSKKRDYNTLLMCAFTNGLLKYAGDFAEDNFNLKNGALNLNIILEFFIKKRMNMDGVGVIMLNALYRDLGSNVYDMFKPEVVKTQEPEIKNTRTMNNIINDLN